MKREYYIVTTRDIEENFMVPMVEGQLNSPMVDQWHRDGGLWDGDTFIPWHSIMRIEVREVEE